MKSNHDLSEEQKSFVKNVVRDPILFANQFLGVSLWEREVEILQSIKTHRRTAVKACHGVGKTFTIAVAALWWLARYPEGIVLTTSPTQRQVRTQLWTEIHRHVERAKVPYPKLKTTELKFRDDNNFAIGFSTNQAENFQGYHGKYVLIIADEAPGIESGIWDAVAGTMAGGKVHIVMAGNPTVPSGAFFDAFTKERGLWHCITIDAFDSPNLKGLKLEELLQLDPTEGGPLDQNPVPYLVTKRWVYDQHLAWWHGSESSSPIWMSRVRAEFPDQAQNALVKMPWLERAKQRPLPSPADARSSPLFAGVDVGGEKLRPSSTSARVRMIGAASSPWVPGAVRIPVDGSLTYSTSSVPVSRWSALMPLASDTTSGCTCATAAFRSNWSMSECRARANRIGERMIPRGAL